MDENCEITKEIQRSEYSERISYDSQNKSFTIDLTDGSEFKSEPDFKKLYLFVRSDLFAESNTIYVKGEHKYLFLRDEDKLILIKNCIFKSPFDIGFEINNSPIFFHNCEFLNDFNFEGGEFNSFFRFEKCVFYKRADFSTVIIKKGIYFENIDFLGTISFEFADILSQFYFKKVTFKNLFRLKNLYTDNNAKIFFTDVQALNGVDLSLSKITCEIKIWKLETPKIPDKSLPNASNITTADLRETYRLLKKNLEQDKNTIEALKFKAYEMDMYRRELEQDKKNKYSGEWWIMKANYWSNDFGLSWKKGAIFTLKAAIVTYILMLIALCPYLSYSPNMPFNFTPLKHLAEIVNVTNWKIALYGHSEYNAAYIILFIGRIFIGFGYYQTIQAF